MTYQDRVAELLSSAEGQATFLEWTQNELTQLLLLAARELARPRPVIAASPDASTSLYEHGASVRANEILDYLSSPRSGPRVGAGAVNGPVPDYGSRAILKEMQDNA